MKRQRLSPGFTLIEVLLVILLIGLLASAVVINFSGDSRDKKLETQTAGLDSLSGWGCLLHPTSRFDGRLSFAEAQSAASFGFVAEAQD